jgi:hypothetical protein
LLHQLSRQSYIGSRAEEEEYSCQINKIYNVIENLYDWEESYGSWLEENGIDEKVKAFFDIKEYKEIKIDEWTNPENLQWFNAYELFVDLELIDTSYIGDDYRDLTTTMEEEGWETGFFKNDEDFNYDKLVLFFEYFRTNCEQGAIDSIYANFQTKQLAIYLGGGVILHTLFTFKELNDWRFDKDFECTICNNPYCDDENLVECEEYKSYFNDLMNKEDEFSTKQEWLDFLINFDDSSYYEEDKVLLKIEINNIKQEIEEGK